MKNLSKARNFSFGILWVEAMEDHLDPLFGLQDIENQGRKGKELTDALNRLDGKSRRLDFSNLNSKFKADLFNCNLSISC